MENGEKREAAPRTGRGLGLLLLAVLIAAAGALFYSDLVDRFTAGYASWVALLAIPAALGSLFVHLAYPEGDLPLLGCLVWPTLGIILSTGLAWLAFGEGAICIAMVLPLWIPAAIAGALVNRWNRGRASKTKTLSRLNSAAWLAFPLLLASGDRLAPPLWLERTVTSEAIIAAPPDRLWPLLVSINAIQPGEGRRNFTQDGLGVPRPTEAVLVARDGRLVRQARWGSDIRFEERITEWQRNRAIGWRFAFPDDSIQRHTDRHVSPDGPILKIENGRYELIPFGRGETRVRLTTRYKMRTSFPGYLSWWGERLLGDVQSNVLAIVKQRAERPQAS